MTRFEAHITIDGRRQVQWEKHCRELDVKQISIALDSGDYLRQEMCTKRFSGQASEAMALMEDLSRQIRRRGHTVLREKLEAEIPHLDLPVTWYLSQRVYYEGHIKLALGWIQRESLLRVRDSLGLSVSSSLLRPRGDGKTKCFLTDRVSGDLSVEDAVAVFAETLEAVRDVFPDAQMERETVLFDSCPEIDGGWKNADLTKLVTRV